MPLKVTTSSQAAVDPARSARSVSIECIEMLVRWNARGARNACGTWWRAGAT